MKIDGQPISADIDPSGATGRTAASKGKDGGVKTGQTSSSDRIEVSSEARLLSTALAAAQSAPEVRADRVEAVRQKLAKGQIGNDVDRLANSMLDDLIEKK